MRAIFLLLVLPTAVFAQPIERQPTGSVELLRRAAATTSVATEAKPTFNGASAKMFATRVQPVLTNLCAGCHTRPGAGGNFRLRSIEPGYSDPGAAEKNIHAAARFLNAKQPSASTLLTMATSSHGPLKEPPLKVRGTPAFQVLELWAHWAVLPEGAPMPTSLKPGVSAQSAPMMPGKGTFASGNEKPAELPVAVVPIGTTVEHLTLGGGGPPPLPSASPKEPPAKLNSNDPFDPAEFNRYAHPGRK